MTGEIDYQDLSEDGQHYVQAGKFIDSCNGRTNLRRQLVVKQNEYFKKLSDGVNAEVECLKVMHYKDQQENPNNEVLAENWNEYCRYPFKGDKR